MKTGELKIKISDGAVLALTNIYRFPEQQTKRLLSAVEKFESAFGEGREAMLLSVPGRSELLGNHTDHNGGKILAAAIDRDIIAVASKNDDGVIRFISEGYPEDVVELSLIKSPENFKRYTSAALIAGVVNRLAELGYTVGGFDVYSTSDVLKGSGISSSAAYEVMIGNIVSNLYNDGKIENSLLAKVAQYAENVYFGKPSGLMDQLACAVGGVIYVDFAGEGEVDLRPLNFNLSSFGYELCIVNTGGNHADLNDDYASVPAEMRAVAAVLGRKLLSGVTEAELISSAAEIRRVAGDRALMRALHFVRECDRVERGMAAVADGDIEEYLSLVNASGNSSFKYLQNLYTVKNVSEQGLSLALAIIDGMGGCAIGAARVHGGGFAGTVQAYVRADRAEEYERLMCSVFGEGSVMRLTVRAVGATRIL